MKKFTLLVITFYGLIYWATAYAVIPIRQHRTYGSSTFESNSDTIRPIKIGDKIPDLVLNSVINSRDGSLKIADFHGKLILLDFWATWCVPCISMMPTLDSLQDEFKNKIQIIGVAYQSKSEVENYFYRSSNLGGKKPGFPDIVNDNILIKLFPHTYLPHFVWISGDGKVIGTTEASQVTRSKIKEVLNGENDKLKIKSDEVEQPYDNHSPIFINSNANAGKELIYHSLLSGYVEGLRGGVTQYPPDESGAKITVRNSPIIWLYRTAYEERKDHFGFNRIVLRLNDSARLNSTLDGESYISWLKAGNGYCYELVVPPRLIGKRYQIMQHDLDFLFPQYRAGIEMMEKECWILISFGEPKALNTTGGNPASSYSLTGFQLHNAPLSNFIDHLNVIYLQNSPYPVLDESHIDHPVDLNIEANLSDVNSINSALLLYGLKFIKAKRKIPVLVIKDQLTSTPIK
ncbi:MAG TPA: TlpA disulfide reductase family protein [Candidatus Babeliaceae bacterium]|nr:TlpA disulfide reductase family protein [Candidatus Babeliaceae bacterium]